MVGIQSPNIKKGIVLVIPSPTYRVQATSDVSTEILSPRCSPEYNGLSDYSGEFPSPT